MRDTLAIDKLDNLANLANMSISNAPPKWNEIAKVAKACGAGDWAMRKWLERRKIPAAWKIKIAAKSNSKISLEDMEIEARETAA